MRNIYKDLPDKGGMAECYLSLRELARVKPRGNREGEVYFLPTSLFKSCYRYYRISLRGYSQYGTFLHDSKVAQSLVILFRLWQVTVTFSACKKGSDQFLSHRLDCPIQASQLKGLKKVHAKLGLGGRLNQRN